MKLKLKLHQLTLPDLTDCIYVMDCSASSKATLLAAPPTWFLAFPATI